MKYNEYPGKQIKVSEIGMGTWQLGVSDDWNTPDEDEANQMVLTALDLGVNFFDTAPNYGKGSSEIRIGKALKDIDREQFVINTKFGHSVNGELNFEAEAIRESLIGSLKRLELEYIDSLILHNPPADILEGNTSHFQSLEKLKNEGLIKAYGASVDTYEDMMLVMNNSGCEVIESFFNILHQDTARAFDEAMKKSVAIIAKIPLDSGWLTGKYDENTTFTDIRSRWSKKDIKVRAGLVDRVREIIGSEADLVQSALSFCIAHEAVTTVIPGSNSLNQLTHNIQAHEDILSDEQIKELQEFYPNEVKPLNLPW